MRTWSSNFSLATGCPPSSKILMRSMPRSLGTCTRISSTAGLGVSRVTKAGSLGMVTSIISSNPRSSMEITVPDTSIPWEEKMDTVKESGITDILRYSIGISNQVYILVLCVRSIAPQPIRPLSEYKVTLMPAKSCPINSAL